MDWTIILIRAGKKQIFTARLSSPKEIYRKFEWKLSHIHIQSHSYLTSFVVCFVMFLHYSELHLKYECKEVELCDRMSNLWDAQNYEINIETISHNYEFS